MIRKLLLAGIAMMTIAISSCDEDTMTLGDSLTDKVDKFKSVTQSYRVKTQSIMTDSVLAHSPYRYLGKIKDPETGSYISCDFMTQFNLLESESTSLFPTFDQIAKDRGDKPVADSCFIRVMISSFQGDSLGAMKMRIHELDRPVPNSEKYYTDFDPEEAGYLRTTNAINITKVYSVSDLTQSDSLRNVLRGSGYYQYVTIPLKDDYTDKNGNIYPGYDPSTLTGTGFGTYILRMYYEHPEYFKNSNTFANKVCPGFYFKTIDGESNMIEIPNTQILVYYHYTASDATVNSSRALISTQEVLQTTHIVNDKIGIKELEKIDTCTFLKTPSGIFTEVTLPIDSIKWLKQTVNGVEMASHENDTIMSAKISFQQMRNQNPLSSVLLKEPTNLLMIPRDRLYSFFESNSVPDNITSYLATYNSTKKTYYYNALSGLINSIYKDMKPHITNADGSINLEKVEAYKRAHPNWNKVVLVPVNLTSTTSNGYSTVSAITNSLSISSVRLVGGEKNKHDPVTITIMYTKNE